MTVAVDQQAQSYQKYVGQHPNSPLFARLAALFLEQGKNQEALRVCDEGLGLYPLYTTGHLIKGKALLALDMRAEARREFELVHELLPTNAHVDQLLAQLSDVGGQVMLQPQGKAAPAAGPAVAELEATAQPAPTVEPTTDAEKWLEQQFTSDQETLGTPIPEAGESAAPAPTQQEELKEEDPLAALYSPSSTEEPSTTATEEEAEAFPSVEASSATTEPESSLEASAFEETPSETTAAEESPAFPGLEGREEATPGTFESASTEETVSEDPFGFSGGAVGTEEAVQEEPSAGEETFGTPSAEDPFGFAGAKVEAEPAPSVGGEAETDAGGSGLSFPEETSAQAEQVSVVSGFDEFSERVAGELSGTENTMSYEEYLGVSTPADLAQETNEIEELAEKLKDAGKITPVINLSEHATPPASEPETGNSVGFVTPTLAEIYAKQGWYDDAIKAYRALAASKPSDKEKYEERISELEEEKKKQQGS